MQLWLDRLASPVGELRLVVDEQGALRALEFDDHDERLHRLLKRHYGRYELIRERRPRPFGRPWRPTSRTMPPGLRH
ncbi:hypothetical protein [Halomonas sp. E19]|uniref:hypothetical protein n=1 Tax=Halomonas sp. E19 TaxID=3397247 RepID=UPI0040349B60